MAMCKRCQRHKARRIVDVFSDYCSLCLVAAKERVKKTGGDPNDEAAVLANLVETKKRSRRAAPAEVEPVVPTQIEPETKPSGLFIPLHPRAIEELEALVALGHSGLTAADAAARFIEEGLLDLGLRGPYGQPA